MQNKFDTLSKLIGHTPLLKIIYKYRGEERRLFAKAEYYNYTGSIKDRMALNVLKKAYDRGTIKAGDVICETTSGNTGISFCALGAFLGHKAVVYMPDWMSEERRKIMSLYGAEVRLVSKEQGGFKGCLRLASEFSAGGNAYCPLQFDNPDNSDSHYLTTAAEIDTQMKAFGINIEAVVAGVGTGGTIMGLHKYFAGRGVKCHPLEPAESPTLKTGHKIGSHRIQGISDEFIPGILKLDELSSVIDVNDGDSILMARNLGRVLGLGVGISSGANFLGAVKAGLLHGRDCGVVTVFPDDNKKYLSSALAGIEPVKTEYLSPDIELVSLEAVRRDF